MTRALTEWTLDPWMLALIVVLGSGYLAGARRVRGWPVARPVWFCGLGLGFLVIATMSWVGVYQSVLIYARAVQTVLLVLVVPLFLVLGRPVRLFAVVFTGAGARLERVICSRPCRILTFPAITTFALVGVPVVMYFTSWYTAVFHSATVRELTYLELMIPGYVFFWTLLRVDPVPKEYPYVVLLWITGVEVAGDAFFGMLLPVSNLTNLLAFAASGLSFPPLRRADGAAAAGDDRHRIRGVPAVLRHRPGRRRPGPGLPPGRPRCRCSRWPRWRVLLRACRGAHVLSKLLERVQRSRLPHEPARLAAHVTGCGGLGCASRSARARPRDRRAGPCRSADRQRLAPGAPAAHPCPAGPRPRRGPIRLLWIGTWLRVSPGRAGLRPAVPPARPAPPSQPNAPSRRSTAP